MNLFKGKILEKKFSKNSVNIFKVANKAGVAISTVSRVINNHEAVSEKTREKALRMGANILDFVFTKNN